MTALILAACLAFLKIGSFAFGGGYAILAFIYREIVEIHGWLSPEEFVDVIAIAEMTPGTIAVNSSTFVGFQLAGFWGGLLCSACILAVPFAICLVVSYYFSRFKDNAHLKNALLGIRPAVVGLIAAACVSVAEISITSLSGMFFFGLALLLVWKFKVHPIVVLVICGGLGAVVYGIFPAI